MDDLNCVYEPSEDFDQAPLYRDMSRGGGEAGMYWCRTFSQWQFNTDFSPAEARANMASAYVRPLSDGGMKLPLGQQVIAEVSCTIKYRWSPGCVLLKMPAISWCRQYYLNGKWNSRQVQLTPVEMRRWSQAAVERWVGG